MWNFYLKKIYKIEYWPFYILYIPLIPLYLYYSIKNKSLIYFTAANPGMHYGGLFNYSKSAINQQIPVQFRLDEIKNVSLKHLPFISKPDQGERGKNVFLISNHQDFSRLKKLRYKIFLQKYDNSPFEFGVFYYRLPNRDKGQILSITAKEFLTYVGNGKTSLRDFILNNEKTFYARKRLFAKYQSKLDLVLRPDEKLILEKIGNHHLGTTFLDGNEYFSKALENNIDKVAQAINGFYYGRFDVKTESLEKFKKGEFKVIEINGANSEPTHIYDPNFSPFRVYKEIYKHLKIQEKISNQNLRNGFQLPSLKKFVKDLIDFLIS